MKGKRAASALARLIPLGLFGLALLVRALPYPSVLGGERVVFFGMDAYYHMRRVLYALQSFPETLTFDPYINFPHGAMPIWPPLFDTLVAMAVWPFYAAAGESVAAAEAAAVWVPALLGAATVVALFATAKKFFGLATATLAGLVLCFLSGHFWYSQLGFIDHHAAVALVSTLLLAAGMSLLAVLARPGDQASQRGAALATGALLALALLLWPGSLLHVALVEVALLTFLLSRNDHQQAIRSAASFALLHSVALLIVLPFTIGADWPQWGDYSPTVLSRFQPWFFGALALHSFACWSFWRRGQASSRGRRAAHAIVWGVAVLLASVVIIPGLVEGAADAWQWLAKEEAFQASVAESMPLFQLQGAFSGRIAEGRLSYFIYLLPLALAGMAVQVRSREDRAALWFFAAWTLGLLAVTLVQRRFFNSLSVALALSLAFSVNAVARRICELASGRVLRAGIFAALCLGLLAVAMAPVWPSYRLPAENFARALRGQPPLPRQAGADLPSLLETADWLRQNTPPTSHYFEARRSDGRATQPEYGVLARSHSGHVLEYAGRRPTISNNFGDDIGAENFKQVHQYFSSPNEAGGLKIADALGARYVVVEKSDPAIRASSLARRLALEDGSGLARHRLMFETSTLGRGPSAHTHKVFEIVPGSLLVGRALPGTLVKLQLELRTNRKRKVVYRSSDRANSEGKYAFHLPYATPVVPARGSEASCCTAPVSSYRIEAAGRSAEVAINEAQIQAGESVVGPDFGS